MTSSHSRVMAAAKPTPDDVLIRRAQALNDKQAFSELVLRHQGKVRALLGRLCQDRALADDLAQDCFLLAYRKIKHYRPTGLFSSWLMKIAFRCYLQDKRLRGRRQEKWHSFVAEQPAPGDMAGQENAKLELERAFAVLTDIETTAITLCYTFGYSHAEIADITASPLGTIKTHIRNGKHKLKKLLTEHLEESSNEGA